MSGPGEVTTKTMRAIEARALGAQLLVFDLLAFVEDSAANSMDSELKARAQVLAARVDIETERLAKQLVDETFCGKHRVSIAVCGCGEHGIW